MGSPDQRAGRLPDFICIGAQKSGTTWLHHNLKQHPEIWLPPVKELHWFDETHPRPNISKVFSADRQGYRARKELPRLWHSRHDSKLFRWHLRFLLRPRNHSWYASLFEPAKDQICGEIGADYAALDEATITAMNRLMPDLKLIYLLRNPVERLWSALAMHAEKQGWGPLENVPAEQLMSYLQWDLPLRHSDYLANLQRWEGTFGPERVKVIFFDALASRPTETYQEVCRYLGVDDSPSLVPEGIAEKKYARDYPPPNRKIAAWLHNALRPQVHALHDRFGNEATAAWLAGMDQ
ncbi:MAG: sulfotransferase family protein [Gammaproteobacteria bacterium]